MRILLDENVDPEFGALLTGHEIGAVAGSDLRGIPDKEMLRIASARFDALVTMDKGIIHSKILKTIY